MAEIYTVRLQLDADPYDTTTLSGTPRGVVKRLQFDEIIATREDAHAFIDQFYDTIETL